MQSNFGFSLHTRHSLSWFFARDVSRARSAVCYVDKCDFNFMPIAQFVMLMIARKVRNNECLQQTQREQHVLG